MWMDNSIFYQIYPLGFCGAPSENDGVVVSRIKKVTNWIAHLSKLGINAVYFSPVFESDRHGYDTRDYFNVDCRLGTNEDFAELTSKLHQNGIKVVMDGVFNHVGRGFGGFEDVRKNRQDSHYKDWFYIDFGGNSPYDDGFAYQGWEGHYELVKLNLKNPEVAEYLFSAVKSWIDNFDIDGLRLDVAYCLDNEFIAALRRFTDSLKPDFALIGEVLFGDYNRIVNESMLHSCTNYECYKGLYSSFNEKNMFEISYSLNRQFGPENWTLYKGKHLLCFADNHDVTRAASILNQKRHLPLLYGILFAMPGIPCIYYGSEWGAEGQKENGDDALRPEFDYPEFNDLTKLLARLSYIHKESPAICEGTFRNVVITNRQYVFERCSSNQKIYVAVNLDDSVYRAEFDAAGIFTELITNQEILLEGGCTMEPYSLAYYSL